MTNLYNFTKTEKGNIANGLFPVYRFIPVYRLFDILSRNELFFLRTSKWDDPFESYLFDKFVSDTNSEYYHLQKHVALKQKLFFLCCSQVFETDHMWKIFTPDKNGVRIRMQLRDISSLGTKTHGDIYIGKVQYKLKKSIRNLIKEYKDPQKNIVNLLRLFFVKRTAYKTEKEIRVVLYKNIDTASDVASIPFHGHKIEEVMFDPRMDKAVFEKYKDHLKTIFQFPNKIFQSSLYDPERVFPI